MTADSIAKLLRWENSGSDIQFGVWHLFYQFYVPDPEFIGV